ncbi:hypothetical protein [Pontibacterium sp.]
MELTATEAKREFDDLILKAQSEAVRISRNGQTRRGGDIQQRI